MKLVAMCFLFKFQLICMWPDTDCQSCIMSRSLCNIHCESLLYDTCPFCCHVGTGGVCVCISEQQICISCQHSGHRNMSNFKLMPCQWMRRGTAYAGSGHSFWQSIQIVSSEHKIRVTLVNKDTHLHISKHQCRCVNLVYQ